MEVKMRANTVIVLVLVLLFPAIAHGQTYISGYIGTQTWTPAGSPYIIIGNTHAMDLTIDAGVAVQFDAFCDFEIEFSLLVNGTESDSVYFTAGDTCWKSIDFASGAASDSRIAYANFEGAGYNDLGAINGGSGNLSLRHCSFRNNDAKYVLKYQSIGNVLVVEDCEFYNNTCDYVLFSQSQDYAIIKGSNFFDNTTHKVIHIDCNYAQNACGCLMYGCALYNNCTVYSGITFTKGMLAFSVFYNTVSPDDYLFNLGSDGVISEVHNCIIWDCDMITNQPDYTKINYCDLEIPYPGEGNISADPLFVDPMSGDFTLNPGSPCIDSGNPGGFWYDYDGSRADMGIGGGSGLAPYPTTIDFPPLWPGEQMEAFFEFNNLNNYYLEILDTYLTSPENFSFLLDPTSSILSPYEKAKYTITFTSPGYERSTDMVINSEGFVVGDTASIHFTGLGQEFTPVSGIWTVENSPYYYNENLIVEDGQQLVIEPGVVVYIDSLHVLKIEGNLQAIGAEEDTIRFYGWNTGWGGIIFEEADGENIFDYVKIAIAKGSFLTSENGGCIYADNSIITINHSLLDGYYDANNGGAIYVINCPQINIENSIIVSSPAEWSGGGIYAENCPQIIIDNVSFYLCSAYEQGGALYLNSSSVSIDSSSFNRSQIHSGAYDGVAVYANDSNLNITRTLFTENCNYSGHDGAAVIALDNSSNLNLDHCDICYVYGSGGYLIGAVKLIDNSSTANAANSIIYEMDNMFITGIAQNIEMTYSIGPEYWPGEGNLVGDPMITEECQLTSGSPCIDAGDPTFPLDPDSTRSDMGVFYWDGSGPMSGAVSGVWTAENSPYIIGEDIYIPEGDSLVMTPGTEVEFSESDISFTIYGVLLVQGDEDLVTIEGEYCHLYFISNQGQSAIEYGDIYFSDIRSEGTTLLEVLHSNIHGTFYLDTGSIYIDSCNIYGSVHAENTSGNTLINSYINGAIMDGTGWTVTNNSFYLSVFGTVEWFSVYADAIDNAEGTFIANDIYAHASSSVWMAFSAGFINCSGTFAHNVIDSYASTEGCGILNSSGTIRHNCIETSERGIKGCSGDIFNNTIINAEYGIRSDVVISPVKNNIVYNCDTGFWGPFEVQYSCVYNCPTPFANGATAGVGTIEEDPLLINTWFLDPNSPCIDAGDPDPFYNDPDGTRDDMGANYFDQGAAYATIALTPYGTPIQIPVSGGSFDFNIAIANSGVNEVVGDVWCNVILPNGNLYGPLLGPINLTLPAGFQLDRDRSQTVPGSAPEGTYTYQGFLGLHPDTIWDMDSFTFEKLTTGDGVWVEDWSNSGESFDEWLTAVDDPLMPETYSLEQNYPNPFNPLTTIGFALPEAGRVQLAVYNMLGRQVAQLVNGYREVGYHEFTFDGSGLASGMYFYRIEAGDFTAVKKMVLVK
ncbi:hypothetical protein CEE37_12195 [candidate division LCP-89 bacterium B3_LCP]|uniref:Secretion system C-terminal sorting domain-containing protein n=1 Tax=candidate division LCP-89 bacterium B3_LCP TaxID=2012998 RepID=A0A532UUC4_UNCL8|nr:MAG: hypothetical protein CEE37_12195 [candidate division LCP-89 bacterium B3_LCP]